MTINVTSLLGSKVTSSLGSKGLKPLVMTTGSAALTQRIKAVVILKNERRSAYFEKRMKAFY